MNTRTLCPLLCALVACSPLDPSDEPTSTSEDAIIGGITDDGHQYVVGVGDEFGPWCSGTLISTQTVLTAAHCIGGINRVHFGTNSMGPPAPAVVVQEIDHPDWQFQGLFPDLALLQLAQPTGVQPAPLLRATLNNSATYMGPDWTFVGYGVSDAVQGTGGGTKRVAAFPFAQLGPLTAPNQQPVTEHYIFYNTNIQSGCHGDSGGPSFFIDGPIEKQGAVTSWGSALCDVFGVYSRADLAYIQSFIQPTLNMFEPNNPCRNDGMCNESCNTNIVLDADCHINHCAADGICAAACVQPVDPDCSVLGVNHCGEDGVCDPSCNPPDPDCGGGSTVSVSSSSVASSSSVSSTSSSSVTVSSSSSSSAASSSSAGGAGGAGGSGGAPPAPVFDDDEFLYGRGCGGCRTTPTAYDPAAWWLLGLALLPVLRRRRRRA